MICVLRHGPSGLLSMTSIIFIPIQVVRHPEQGALAPVSKNAITATILPD